jgi:hypothetical protein
MENETNPKIHSHLYGNHAQLRFLSALHLFCIIFVYYLVLPEIGLLLLQALLCVKGLNAMQINYRKRNEKQINTNEKQIKYMRALSYGARAKKINV